MSSDAPETSARTIHGSAFGVRLQFEADSAETEAMVRECLPPVWGEGENGLSIVGITVTRTGEDAYEVQRNGATTAAGGRTDVLEDLDHLVRAHIATNAPDHIFIHAGTAACEGHAIVIPGQSFSGKTTLVTELVRAGALYYSDEYAVVDQLGFVHPYPKPLSIRLSGKEQYTRVSTGAAELGGAAGTEPLRIGLVVVTQYRTRARWAPVELSRSETVLELMSNTFSALERPDTTLAALGLAVEAATGLKGERGEAAELVPNLLSRLAGHR